METTVLGAGRWHTFPAGGTTMTAREFLAAAEPLLQGVIDDCGLTAADGPVLEEQIRATLALGTRESSLPLNAGPHSSRAARELSGQAAVIGEQLAGLATEALAGLLTHRIELPAGPLVVRSHCYGHLLTPPAADLLLRGERGGPVTMQLYNEWLHQVVLLRDALLPFTDWADVPVFVGEAGLRHLEPARDAFLTELLVRQIRHTSIVAFAQHVVTGAGGPAGYGFDAPGGTVLPAVLDQPPAIAPRYLLTWRPDPAVRTTATYRYELQDYYAADRTPPSPAAVTGTPVARVVPGPVSDGVRTAAVEVTTGDVVARVDLGQALRGHRFASRDAAAGLADADVGAWSVLRAPGLVRGRGVVNSAGLDDRVVLALLGKLYPDGVTLGERVIVLT
ncbi:hypothetical protein ACTI_73790 [Actinoplanes sp. OR16]|uniref:hypothetical protein n=1 Tax=Actinoplanes sp. OR16 TaxID=946334 RepID=UPI000F6C0856|nr:hypothetical protein [Actinoplanes sp. OR16]BBH70694.1 hypothetical protein ACTI_73790 [Actinoplanes sp. OR16]